MLHRYKMPVFIVLFPFLAIHHSFSWRCSHCRSLASCGLLCCSFLIILLLNLHSYHCCCWQTSSWMVLLSLSFGKALVRKHSFVWASGVFKNVHSSWPEGFMLHMCLSNHKSTSSLVLEALLFANTPRPPYYFLYNLHSYMPASLGCQRCLWYALRPHTFLGNCRRVGFFSQHSFFFLAYFCIEHAASCLVCHSKLL